MSKGKAQTVELFFGCKQELRKEILVVCNGDREDVRKEVGDELGFLMTDQGKGFIRCFCFNSYFIPQATKEIVFNAQEVLMESGNVSKFIQAGTEGYRSLKGTKLVDMMMQRRVDTQGHQGASERICIMMKLLFDGATTVESRSRPGVRYVSHLNGSE